MRGRRRIARPKGGEISRRFKSPGGRQPKTNSKAHRETIGQPHRRERIATQSRLEYEGEQQGGKPSVVLFRPGRQPKPLRPTRRSRSSWSTHQKSAVAATMMAR